MLFAGVAFIISAILQATIDKEIPVKMKSGQTKVQIVNTASCVVQVSAAGFGQASLDFLQNTDYRYMASGDPATFNVDWTDCDPAKGKKDYTFTLTQKVAYQLFICNDFNVTAHKQEKVVQTEHSKSTVRVFNAMDIPMLVKLKTVGGQEAATDQLGTAPPYGVSKYDDELIIVTDFYVDISSGGNSRRLSEKLYSKNGGVYTAVLYTNSAKSQDLKDVSMKQITDIKPWSINIFLQTPQYVIITIGEVLFSITGLSFSYTQAPVSMKSLLSAGWLMTVAFGNVISLIVEIFAGNFLETVYLLILFAGLLFFITAIFLVMCQFYDYAKIEKTEEAQD